MPRNKQRHLESLTSGFPWLSCGLAKKIVGKLSDADLLLLQEELKEAEIVTRRHFARHLSQTAEQTRTQILTAYSEALGS
jgi:peptidyl-tRNA hydrolase